MLGQLLADERVCLEEVHKISCALFKAVKITFKIIVNFVTPPLDYLILTCSKYGTHAYLHEQPVLVPPV